MNRFRSNIHVLGAFALLAYPLSGAAQPQGPRPFDAELAALGRPTSLGFLNDLDLMDAAQPDLAAAIRTELRQAVGAGPDGLARVERDIRGRLNALAVAQGALDPNRALRSLGGQRSPSAQQVEQFQTTLRGTLGAIGGNFGGRGFAELTSPTQTRDFASAVLGLNSIVLAGTPIRPGSAPDPSLLPAGFTQRPTIVNPGISEVGNPGALQCNTPFRSLAGTIVDGRRSERFDVLQFREVVRLITTRLPNARGDGPPAPANTLQACSGTLIARDWVLTAAHCFMIDAAGHHASTASVSPGADYDLTETASHRLRHQVGFLQANVGLGFLNIRPRRVIVHRDYSPDRFGHDVALVQLQNDDVLNEVRPAQLAPAGDFQSAITIAGFGYTNDPLVSPGTLLNVGWQSNATWAQGQTFLTNTFDGTSPSGSGQSGICPGDSGGPLFTGLHRGCGTPPPADGAIIPRRVAGISSNIHGSALPVSPIGGDCLRVRTNAFTPVVNSEIRRWICARTGNAAGGCV